MRDAPLAARIPWHYVTVLAFISVSSLIVHVYFYPLGDPSATWGDHYWYWTQANGWLGVGEPLVLQSQAQAYLDSLYGTVSYADRANDPAFQPPYVYRPLVSIAAGSLGHITGIKGAFLLLAVLSALALSFFAGLAVLKFTGSLMFAVLAACIALWLPTDDMKYIIVNFASVDIEALAVVAGVVALLAFRKFTAAIIVAAVAAPLIRETLLPLAFCVAIYALLNGQRKVLLYVMAVLPLIIFGLLRALVPVAAPMPLSDIVEFGNPLAALYLFIDAFGIMYLLVVGMFSLGARVREMSIAFFPFAVFLFVVLSSVLSVSRHWLVFWPVILIIGTYGLAQFGASNWLRVAGAVVVAATVVGAQFVPLGLSSRDVVWVLLGIGCVWLFAAQVQTYLCSQRRPINGSALQSGPDQVPMS